MKTTLILAAIAALAASLGASAETRSTPSEMRGYQACLDASAQDYRGLVTNRTYLIEKRADQRTYYINATAWQDGERVNVGLRCETDRNGRLITAAEPTNARYVPAGSTVQIAGQ